MSVDLEDYFCDLPFSEWGNYQSRLKITTQKILKLFKKYNVTATFFVVGHLAEQFPDIIEDIKKQGHEIASHSHTHIDLRKITPEEFEKDLKKSIDTIEKISKEKVKGFRAPFFSVSEENIEMFKIMKIFEI